MDCFIMQNGEKWGKRKNKLNKLWNGGNLPSKSRYTWTEWLGEIIYTVFCKRFCAQYILIYIIFLHIIHCIWVTMKRSFWIKGRQNVDFIRILTACTSFVLFISGHWAGHAQLERNHHTAPERSCQQLDCQGYTSVQRPWWRTWGVCQQI